MPSSKIKFEMLKVMKEQGYIKDYERTDDNKQGVLKVHLKYYGSSNNSYELGKHTIVKVERVSKLGRRVYSKSKDIQPVYNGLGTAILSTSKGIKTDKEARRENLGGEILCRLW